MGVGWVSRLAVEDVEPIDVLQKSGLQKVSPSYCLKVRLDCKHT